jgi:hypothetical protein
MLLRYCRRVLVGAIVLMSACAPPLPVALRSTYTEHLSASTAVQKASPDCRVHIVKLTDERHSPELLGIVLGRAVRAPPDADAWLRSIMNGLQARGVMPVFEDDRSESAAPVEVQVSLLIAWLTDTGSNKTANVVLHVQTRGPGAEPVGRDYRGGSSTIDWSASADELQSTVDRAFAAALDKSAVDFRQLCSK